MINSEAKISVVIPTYNGAEFICEALESVLEQTLLSDEIIVVDDGSSDNTCDLVNDVARKSTIPIRLTVLNQNSGGPSRPLNVGIGLAKGEVIFLLDQDDRMRPRKIELQLRTLRSQPDCVLAIGGLSIVDREEGDVSPLWPAPQFDELKDHLDSTSMFSVIESKIAFVPLLRRNYAASCSNFCFTKQNWQAIGKFNEKIKTCSDLDFILRATIAGPIAIINEKLFDYRWRTSSLQRLSVLRSSLEATMVRLRAATAKPEWAGEEIHALRYSAFELAVASVRKGEFAGIKAIVETLRKHEGILTIQRTVRNKALASKLGSR